MENVQRVTTHVRRKLGEDSRPVTVLTLIQLWTAVLSRVMGLETIGARIFSSKTRRTHETASSPQQAYEAARAFGRFSATPCGSSGNPGFMTRFPIFIILRNVSLDF